MNLTLMIIQESIKKFKTHDTHKRTITLSVCMVFIILTNKRTNLLCNFEHQTTARMQGINSGWESWAIWADIGGALSYVTRMLMAGYASRNVLLANVSLHCSCQLFQLLDVFVHPVFYENYGFLIDMYVDHTYG